MTTTRECASCGERFPLALRQGRNSRRARAGHERSYQDQRYCSATCRKLASKARKAPSTGLVSGPQTRLKAKPLSGVTTATAEANRGWSIVAGPELTPSQFHCAIVRAREAVESFADINAAHWKAARAGERGYRLPDDERRPDLGPKSNTGPATAALIATIPDDLSIPAFLDRRPLPRQELAEAA